MNQMWRSFGAGLALLSASPAWSQPGAAVDEPLGRVVAAYNHAVRPEWALTVATAAPDASWQASSRTVPDWLSQSGLTDLELRALIAAIGTLGFSPERPARERGPSPGKFLAAWVGKMAVDYAQVRRGLAGPSNTLASEGTLFDDTPTPRQPAPRDRHADLHALLIALDTCAGAYFAGLARLNQGYPDSPVSAFARETATTAFAGPVKASPDCVGGD